MRGGRGGNTAAAEAAAGARCGLGTGGGGWGAGTRGSTEPADLSEVDRAAADFDLRFFGGGWGTSRLGPPPPPFRFQGKARDATLLRPALLPLSLLRGRESESKGNNRCEAGRAGTLRSHRPQLAGLPAQPLLRRLRSCSSVARRGRAGGLTNTSSAPPASTRADDFGLLEFLFLDDGFKLNQGLRGTEADRPLLLPPGLLPVRPRVPAVSPPLSQGSLYSFSPLPR